MLKQLIERQYVLDETLKQIHDVMADTKDLDISQSKPSTTHQINASL